MKTANNMKNCKSAMVKKIIYFLCGLFVFGSAFADDCSQYKKDVDRKLTKAEWKVTTAPSDDDLWPVGGYVNVRPFSLFTPKIEYVYNGKYYCVYLTEVQATVGFKDFEVIINKNYKKDSCEYNAVLTHENHHIADAEDAFNKIFPEIEDALRAAAKDVDPIYTTDADEVPYAIEKIQDKVMKYKKLTDLVEQFKTQQADDAAVLDGAPDENLRKCEEEKMKAAFEKYYKNKNKK